MEIAYIDPGSGSMLLQVLLAGLLSVPFLFRRAIASGIRRLRGQANDYQAKTRSADDSPTGD
jgi:hypothetical protein